MTIDTNYIKSLTNNDKKTLTEKVAKLFEEGGELAKLVLPFEGAYATNHRVTTRRQILEEVVDVHLVNQSILYSLGFSDEEFENMVMRKAQIWNSLQVKEDRALLKGDKMPYEIHITVSIENHPNFHVDDFRFDCKEIKVKPIILDLQKTNANSIMKDYMTSSVMFGNNGEAFDEMKRISKALTDRGYDVIREKIEASYWHQKAPFKEDGDTVMPEGCYFECHFNVECSEERRPHLSIIAMDTDSHLSRNQFKTLENGMLSYMLTYRSYDKMYEDFEDHLKTIKQKLKMKDFRVEKEIVEFSIYDTKVSHDQKWIEA